MDPLSGADRMEPVGTGDARDSVIADREALLTRLEERRDRLRTAAQTPSKADEILISVTRYTRAYPWATLTGALLAGALLGRLARRGGLALLLPLALPVLRQQLLPRVVNSILSGARRSKSAH